MPKISILKNLFKFERQRQLPYISSPPKCLQWPQSGRSQELRPQSRYPSRWQEPSSGSHRHCPSGLHQQEAAVKSHLGLGSNPGPRTQNMCILTCISAPRPNAHPSTSAFISFSHKPCEANVSGYEWSFRSGRKESACQNQTVL